MKFFTIILLALMVGCSPSIHMPSLTKQAPDVLTNDTEVVVAPAAQRLRVEEVDRGLHDTREEHRIEEVD